MKSQTSNTGTETNSINPLCENSLSNLRHLPQSLLRFWQCLALIRSWTSSTLASLTCPGGRLAYLKDQSQIILNELIANRRFCSGVCLVAVTPFAFWAYRFFDVDARDYDWYYINWAFFLFTIKEELAGIFLSLGFFVALPQKWSFRWFLVPVAVFCVTEIYLIWGYDDWRDFYSAMPPWQVWAVVLTIIPALFLSAEYTLYRKYHLKDGNTARIRGIIRAPGLTIDERFRHLEQLIEEQENYNARI